MPNKIPPNIGESKLDKADTLLIIALPFVRSSSCNRKGILACTAGWYSPLMPYSIISVISICGTILLWFNEKTKKRISKAVSKSKITIISRLLYRSAITPPKGVIKMRGRKERAEETFSGKCSSYWWIQLYYYFRGCFIRLFSFKKYGRKPFEIWQGYGVLSFDWQNRHCNSIDGRIFWNQQNSKSGVLIRCSCIQFWKIKATNFRSVIRVFRCSRSRADS